MIPSAPHFDYKEGVLRAENVSLANIAEAVGTPTYVYSKEAFLEPLRKLQKGLDGLNPLICFAVKANSNIQVLRALSEAGAGMDLVSGGEFFRTQKAGVPSERVVFSGVGKTPSEMAMALEHGIYSFHVESMAELDMLNEVAIKLGTTAPFALRFNPDVDAKTHPYISTGLKRNKFGLNRKEVEQVVKLLPGWEGLQMKGLSIHIGSQLTSLKPLDESFSRLTELVDAISPLLPEPLEFVDLGGGVGIRYRDEKPPTLEAYCKLIQKHFAKRAKGPAPLRVLIEPGRTLAGNAGVLLTEALYRKPRGKKDFLVVDAAMNDLIRPALYGSWHDIVPVEKAAPRASKHTFDVVGPVCESSDCFASDRALPSSIETGSLLAILSCGAYGFSMSSNYNTRPRPAEVWVDGDSWRVIRQRETYEDLIRGEEA